MEMLIINTYSLLTCSAINGSNGRYYISQVIYFYLYIHIGLKSIRGRFFKIAHPDLFKVQPLINTDLLLTVVDDSIR
ncbi:hypothetical protein HanRHA438_Chr05g0235331 [Helianthus annuus]|nr:hypothetical protein HanRHA438_Chr05g0235331 [Helianthus annuus]